MYDILIVGSGIAGLSCVIKLIQSGESRPIRIFEKHSRLGGNSALATSGLSVLDSVAGDTEHVYMQDIKEDNPVVRRVCRESAHILDFLKSVNIELPHKFKTGMHSMARTYTNTSIDSNIGSYIINKMVAFIRKSRNVYIHTLEPIIDMTPVSHGVYTVKSTIGTYTSDMVVFSTGGYGYNRTMLSSINTRYRTMPTSNKCDIMGDGLRLLVANGAVAENMQSVQVHPTGFITQYVLSESELPERIWLCPEIFRSKGAILVDRKGNRFIDELESRDKITNSIFKHQGVAVMLFPPSIKDMYIARVYMKEGHIVPNAKNKNYPYMAYVTPCIHFTMGGIRVDSNFRVLDRHHRPIHGLYAIGELPHVFNRYRACGLGLVTGIASGMIVGSHGIPRELPRIRP